MINIEFVNGIKAQGSNCPMCCDTHAMQVLSVNNMKYKINALHLSQCLACGTLYFVDENPVIGYDFNGFNQDYWYNYVQNGAGISAMLEPLLAISSSIEGDLLDVGCGFGFVPHYWEKMGHGVAVGLETSLYGKIGSEKLGTNIIPKYYKDAIEIDGRKFDYVFSSEVIEHTPDPRAFVDEISSALADDGILVLTTPSAECVRPSVDFATIIATLSPGFHYFVTTKDALKELLRSCGFEHIHVHDTGTRLMAWASHKELPEIEVGFRDWESYINYLEALQGHSDLHIAGGAAYRALKDSVNTGRWSSANAAYPRLLEISKLQYGIDLSAMGAVGAVEAIDFSSGFRTIPSWLGCSILFCGLVEKSRGATPEKLAKLFRAATEIMKHEIKIGAQFAQEPSHFIEYAEKEYRSAAGRQEFGSLGVELEGISERARTMLKEIQKNADSDSFYRKLGQELAKSGHQEEAEEVLAKACRLAPDNALNHTALGAVFMNARKLAEAHDCFRYALNCAPEARSIHALIASTSLGLKAVALAEHHARRALAPHEGPELETDALARTILNTALLHSKKATEISGVDMISGGPEEQALLAAMRELDQGDFESGLCDIAPLIEGSFEDNFSRDIFRQGFARFKNESEGTRFEEFVEALGLEPLADTAPASAQNIPSPSSIDIIIPVHNALDDLKTCITSIRKWPNAAMGRIILVNDASDDLTCSWMEQQAVRYADIHLIHTPENLGFTRTVMAGMRNSDAPFAVMLNSDTVVTAGWLEGLWRAMNRRNTTAPAGPLTNNSYYQTIQPYETSTLADAPDRIAAMVLSKSRDATPVVPLLSGFCLLVQRDAFDAVGGLDEQGFPSGYWEVQDLCLKLKDAGFEAVIADDVYVHHSGSKSIATSQKKLLISQGFDLICERYSAIRLHAAEALCAIEPTIWRSKQAWANLEAELAGARPQEDAAESPEKGPAAFSIIKHPEPFSLRNELCLFVAHAPLGTLSEYTLEYIQGLRETGISVLVCMTTENRNMPVDPCVSEVADGLVLRQNLGYDFAAWADMLQHFPQVWQAERLYFVNDSITGPFRPLDEMIANIRAANAGFFALTDCSIGSYHLQSFFFGWSGKNLRSPVLREFWRSVTIERNKQDVIDKYEREICKLSDVLPVSTQDVLFGFNKMLHVEPSKIPDFSMSHHAWKLLISNGFPFVKTQVLRDAISDEVNHEWEGVCISHGADIGKLRRHLEQSRINRL